MYIFVSSFVFYCFIGGNFLPEMNNTISPFRKFCKTKCLQGWLVSVWPKVEGGELYSSHLMHVQLNSLSDCAESLYFITFVVFLFQVIENCTSALSEKWVWPLCSHLLPLVTEDMVHGVEVGGPVTVTTQETFNKIHDMIFTNQQITPQYIVTECFHAVIHNKSQKAEVSAC